jgi:hypothetical protein
MCSHLFSLYPSIWEIVESGMKFDSSDSPMFINEQIHKSQVGPVHSHTNLGSQCVRGRLLGIVPHCLVRVERHGLYG